MPELRAPEIRSTAGDVESQASRFVRVLVADDQSVVQSGCRLRLETEPHVVVVGETSRTDDLVGLARRVVPRVIVVAMRSDQTTIELVGSIGQAAPASDVVVVSTRADEAYVRQCLTAGARAYVRHDDPAIGRAVRAVAAGGAYFSPDVAALLRDGFLRNGGISIDRLLRQFSDLERAVLRGLLAGLSSKDLAEGLDRPVDAIHRSRDRIAALLATADADLGGALRGARSL
jgi:DNA-binding NarL/FixJ family response regulator